MSLSRGDWVRRLAPGGLPGFESVMLLAAADRKQWGKAAEHRGERVCVCVSKCTAILQLHCHDRLISAASATRKHHIWV